MNVTNGWFLLIHLLQDLPELLPHLPGLLSGSLLHLIFLAHPMHIARFIFKTQYPAARCGWDKGMRIQLKVGSD
jgi:hypothetical protein